MDWARCRASIVGVLVVSACLAAFGCAATPYQPMDRKGGYDDFRVSDDVFEVTFKGNAYTARECVSRYVLRRACEVTLAHGFTHFQPLLEIDRTRFATVHRDTGFGHVHGDFAFYGAGGYETVVEKPATTLRIRAARRGRLLLRARDRHRGRHLDPRGRPGLTPFAADHGVRAGAT